ncbi:hypothetical protein GCM10011504_52780 [Siccirubricoccus deserti]|uniref:Uncharacterized protein n=1 Tax=Siccirubricoccus deserti TaxID=2013562 RepID=A0A9X0UGC5_9PROT|nr:hypothetical protein [Siccirubricoccus deserti]MBC4018778.1 hypothetical protein [Siccirubricoccus deserti]GGC68260.1 hypothetical protein GCM10011504_52780 [Siccirubricoccus deserti]
MFGFGAAGVAAAEMAAAACCALCDYEDPKWLAVRGGMQSGSDAANVVLASEWSFSVLCCDGTDENALSEAEATARALVQRGHMAVVMEAGPSAPLMNAPYQMADGRDLPAHLLLPVCDGPGGIVPTLAAAAAALLSSVACRGIVGVDASDIWSAIGGHGLGLAVHTVAGREQKAAAFGQSALSAAYEVGVRPSSVRRLLINAVLRPGWHLRELDELATTVSAAFENAGTAIMSAVYNPAADTASVLLVCS